VSLSTAELTSIRADAESTMFDTCQIGVKAKVVNTKSPNVGLFSWGADGSLGDSVSCGVNLGKSGEAKDGSAATLTDGVIRLPIGTTDYADKAVSSKHRIKVTYRHGVELDTAEFYSIEGEPRLGISALLCSVTRVVGESTK